MRRPLERFMINEVRVHPKGFTEDSTGSPVPHDLPPVTVRGMMRPLDSKEYGATGLTVFNSMAFVTLEKWPYGAATHIEWLDKLDAEGQPRQFDQHGSAIEVDHGRPTDNTVIYLVERDASL